MSKKLYFFVLLSILLAITFRLITLETYKSYVDRAFAPPEHLTQVQRVPEGMSAGLGVHQTEPPPRPAPSKEIQEEIARDRLYNFLSPLAIPAQARPLFVDTLLFSLLPSHVILSHLFTLEAIFLGAQILLLLRRLRLCVRAKKICPPALIHPLWNKVLGLGLVAWLIGIFISFSSTLPIMLSSELPIEMSPELFMLEATMISSIAPYFFLAAGNFLGPVFFVLELWSLFKEGVAPDRHTPHAE